MLIDYNSDDFFLSTYQHHLDLFHSRRSNYNEATSFSRQQVVYYGSQLIDKKLLTKDQFELDLLPRVDFADLFGRTGNIGEDEGAE